MKLKRCCRTCKHLYPQLDSGDCYDYEENFTPNYTSINCEYCGEDAPFEIVNNILEL